MQKLSTIHYIRSDRFQTCHNEAKPFGIMTKASRRSNCARRVPRRPWRRD
jgi:hypothetical protein